MKLQLIQGHFSPQEAIDMITKMLFVKIKFHEDKINSQSGEEDTKMREKRITQLQKELFEIRKLISAKTGNIEMNAVIEIS